MEQQLELAEQDSQEYQEYLTALNNETEEAGSVPALEAELNQLLTEEAELMDQLQVNIQEYKEKKQRGSTQSGFTA